MSNNTTHFQHSVPVQVDEDFQLILDQQLLELMWQGYLETPSVDSYECPPAFGINDTAAYGGQEPCPAAVGSFVWTGLAESTGVEPASSSFAPVILNQSDGQGTSNLADPQDDSMSVRDEPSDLDHQSWEVCSPPRTEYNESCCESEDPMTPFSDGVSTATPAEAPKIPKAEGMVGQLEGTEVTPETQPTKGINEHGLHDTNDKPYGCPYRGCTWRFKRRHDCKRHIRTIHTREEIYSCTLCPQKFVRSDPLRKHLLEGHGIQKQRRKYRPRKVRKV